MEGVIPDITAAEIERNRFIPNFKEGKFYQGIDEATTDIMLKCSGLYRSEARNYQKGLSTRQIIMIIVVVGVIILIAFKSKGGGSSGRFSSGGYYGGGFGGFGGGSSGGGGGFSGF